MHAGHATPLVQPPLPAETTGTHVGVGELLECVHQRPEEHIVARLRRHGVGAGSAAVVAAEGEVRDPDVVRVAARDACEDGVDPVQDLAVAAVAGAVEDLDRDDRGGRSDADGARVDARGRRDPGDLGAVALVVLRVVGVARSVVGVVERDRLGAQGSQLRVRPVHTGVEDRDPDPGPVVRRLDGADVHEHPSGDVQLVHAVVDRDSLDARVGCQQRERRRRHAGVDGSQVRVALEHPHPGRREVALEAVARLGDPAEPRRRARRGRRQRRRLGLVERDQDVHGPRAAGHPGPEGRSDLPGLRVLRARLAHDGRGPGVGGCAGRVARGSRFGRDRAAGSGGEEKGQRRDLDPIPSVCTHRNLTPATAYSSTRQPAVGIGYSGMPERGRANAV